MKNPQLMMRESRRKGSLLMRALRKISGIFIICLLGTKSLFFIAIAARRVSHRSGSLQS